MRQQRTPDELRSRVFAAGEAIVVIAMSASIAVGGPLIAAAGPRAAYALTGFLGLLATVTIWWGAWELHDRSTATLATDVAAERTRQRPGGSHGSSAREGIRKRLERPRVRTLGV